MNPELVLKFHQRFKDLHINSAMGVDEKNIKNIALICYDLANLADDLYVKAYPEDFQNHEEIVNMGTDEKPENDVVEAKAELRTKVKPHKPASK